MISHCLAKFECMNPRCIVVKCRDWFAIRTLQEVFASQTSEYLHSLILQIPSVATVLCCVEGIALQFRLHRGWPSVLTSQGVSLYIDSLH